MEMPAQTLASGNETFSPLLKSSRPPVEIDLSRFGPRTDDIVFTTTKRRWVVPPPSTGLDDTQDELHCLKLTGGEQGGELFVIGSAGLKIGRSAPADIFLAHPSVSREHCLIGLANDELFVTDLNSTNGTFVAGQRVGRTTILPVGAVLKVGHVSLTHETRTRAETAQLGRRANIKRCSGFRPVRLAAVS